MEKKKFLFVSHNAISVDIAWNVKLEGHDVKYCTRLEDERDVGTGFLEIVPEWEEFVDWADIIVFDEVTRFGAWARELREKGKFVVGGTAYTDKLEEDREFGQQELKKAGVPILHHKEFFDFDSAIEYVENNPDYYVIKPSGEIQCNKDLIYIGDDKEGKDVIQVLNDYKNNLSDKIKVFQLQKRVTGVEIGVGAFFNGKKFIYPININFEHKKLFPSNVGPSTGEMGTAMLWTGPNKIFNQTLKKMEPKLSEEGYVGYIDVNCIVNGKGIYPLEFTSRFGYPTISIQIEGIINPIGEFFYDLARGKDVNLKVKQGYQIGVRVVIPPFPFDDPKTFKIKSKDVKIRFKGNLNKNGPRKPGIHFEDIKLVEEDWVITGSSGQALIVCGTGNSMKEAQEQAYSRIKNISIPNMYYRQDIGNRWYEDYDKLHAWGYLRDK